MNTIHIDGSMGEGGGQVLRSALSLSVLTGQAIRIDRIRANRAKPGLMRQHLMCVKAAQQISAADVGGAELGSTSLTFHPNTLVGGQHHFAIGTAGSINLVLQTLLPPLLRADQESRITIEGGTHNQLAPSTCFLKRAFLPMLARMGAKVTLDVIREGLFPAGGGQVVLHVTPSALHGIDVLTRGEAVDIGAEAFVAAVPEHVALREITTVADHYRLKRQQVRHRVLGSGTGPGNVLSVWADYANVTELVTVHGERNLSAEAVATRACRELDAYIDSKQVVGEHLADQMLLPLWLAGSGGFSCGPLSSHTRTNLATIALFDGPRLECVAQNDRTCHISATST